VSVPARRKQVAYGRERDLSARRACTLFSVARSALDYQCRRGNADSEVIERMRTLSAQYPRYDYRRIRIFLARDGYPMSVGRAYRLWRLAKLQVPRKRGRRRVATSRPRPQTPTAMNQVWSYDFVFDVDARIRSPRVVEVLSRLVSERRTPRFLRSDTGLSSSHGHC
jgi:putative transposase